MQKDFFIKYSIDEIKSMISAKKLKVEDLLNLSDQLHKKFNKEFKFTESFNINQEIKYQDRDLGSIPYLAKDIFNTKLFKTEMGSIIWKDFCPGNNARIIDNINSSGGILIGKTVTSEFAIHAANKTLNPFNKSRKVGTSSSGSAVAVALGVIPFALATQTAGSIIRPSSFCGIFGMKPTYGLLPRTGILKTTDTLDNPGFLTGNIHSLKSMSVCQMVYTMLKNKKIVNIGILGSKITGGTFVNVFANDFLFSESPKNTDQLFSGKRVSASVRSSDNTEMPSDFGQGCFLQKHGMIDGCFSSRLEVKDRVVKLTKVLLKKAEAQAKKESDVTVDKSIQSAS